jgi:hypothetical protein
MTNDDTLDRQRDLERQIADLDRTATGLLTDAQHMFADGLRVKQEWHDRRVELRRLLASEAAA